MDNRVLQIVLQAKDEASKTLKKFGDEAEKVSSTLKEKLEKNTVTFGAAFAATTGVIVSSIAAYSESENSMAQLNNVLESTRGKAGMTADAVTKLSSALQQQSKFGDEAITDAQSLLLTFTSIGKDVFPQAIKTVLDMSQALGQDLKSSTIQLGKALNDPINGVTALRRVGVSFTEEQLKQIETLQESGKLMEAQKIILNELATEFGGSALAASKTFDGQMVILKNNINDLQETIGKGLVAALFSMTGGMEGANETVKNLNTFLSEHEGVLMGISYALIAVAAAFGALLIAALAATAGIGVGLALLAGGLIAGFAFAIGYIIANFNTLKAEVTKIFNEIGMQLNAVKEIAVQVGNNIKNAFQNAFNALPNIVKSALKVIGDMILGFNPVIKIGLNLPDIIGQFNNLKTAARKAGVPGFADGGWVGETGLAVVHKGEYVLSRDMLQGRQQIQAPISGGATVTLGPVYVQSMNDVDSALRRISQAYKFDSSI